MRLLNGVCAGIILLLSWVLACGAAKSQAMIGSPIVSTPLAPKLHYVPGEVLTYDVDLESTTAIANPGMDSGQETISASVIVRETVDKVNPRNGVATLKLESTAQSLEINGSPDTGKGLKALSSIKSTVQIDPLGQVPGFGWSEDGIDDRLKNVDYVNQRALFRLFLPKNSLSTFSDSPVQTWNTTQDNGVKMTLNMYIGALTYNGSDVDVPIKVTKTGMQLDNGTDGKLGPYTENAAYDGEFDEVIDGTSGVMQSIKSTLHKAAKDVFNDQSGNPYTLQTDQTWTTDAELQSVDLPN